MTRDVCGLAVAAIACLLCGCPKNAPVARGAAAVETLSSLSQNCVTVHRNPLAGSVETVGCMDSVSVIVPRRFVVAVAEAGKLVDVVTENAPIHAAEVENEIIMTSDVERVNRGFVEALVESTTTSDSFACPKQVRVAASEALATVDALTCGG